VSEDPISFAAGDVNVYRYVRNHPTRAADPSGLEEKSTPLELPPGFPVPAVSSQDYEPKIVDYGYGPKYSPKEIFLDMKLHQKTYGGKMVPPAYAPWDTPEYKDWYLKQWVSHHEVLPMSSTAISIGLDVDGLLPGIAGSIQPVTAYYISTPKDGFVKPLSYGTGSGYGGGLGADSGVALTYYTGKFCAADLQGEETQFVFENPILDVILIKEGSFMQINPKYWGVSVEVSVGPGTGIYIMNSKNWWWMKP
jgi:hypothetical protein